jgi:hypothetical protein
MLVLVTWGATDDERQTWISHSSMKFTFVQYYKLYNFCSCYWSSKATLYSPYVLLRLLVGTIYQMSPNKLTVLMSVTFCTCGSITPCHDSVSYHPLTAEAQAYTWVSPCEICGEQSGTGTGYSLLVKNILEFSWHCIYVIQCRVL